MTSGIRLGKVHGAPVVADISAFVLVLLFAVAVMIDLRVAEVASSEENWVVALVAGVLMVGSVFLHEVTHVVVAANRGLNVRMIRIYLFGGYSVIDGDPSPSTEFFVAISGPIMSLVLGGATWILSGSLGDDSSLGRAVFALAIGNVAVGLFNLIPGFPLDGGRALRGLLASGSMDRLTATKRVTMFGFWTGYALIGAGVVLLFRREIAGLFFLPTGWFLLSAANSAGRREQLSLSFDGMTVRDAMREVPEAVSGSWTVSHLVEMHSMGPRLRSVPVEVDGRVVGVIGEDEIENTAPARWPSMRVKSVMTEIGPDDLVPADDPLESLLLRPAGRSGRAIVVDDTDTVIGIIEGADLARVMP